MNTRKYFFAILALVISQMTLASAADEKKFVASDAHIATCLTLTTMNDDWHEVSFDINKKPDLKAIVSPFEKKLRDSMKDNCAFLFDEWDAPSRTIIDDRITAICSDDPNHATPYLVNSLHCKQARATP